MIVEAVLKAEVRHRETENSEAKKVFNFLGVFCVSVATL